MNDNEMLANDVRMLHLFDQQAKAGEESERELGMIVVAACLMIAGFAGWLGSELAYQDIDDRLIYFLIMFEGSVMVFHTLRLYILNNRLNTLSNKYLNTLQRYKDADAN